MVINAETQTLIQKESIDQSTATSLSILAVLRRYVWDYVGVIALVGLSWCFNKEPTFQRFYLREASPETSLDPSLSYPLSVETVNSLDAHLFSLSPLVFCTSYLICSGGKEFAWLRIHSFFLSFCEANALCLTFTLFTKNFAGRLRPDFYSRLQTGDNKVIDDGMHSYFSGHSSFAFCAMIFVALFFCGKLRIFSTNRNAFGKFCIFGVMPILAALFVAVSRTRDYRHHFSDINMGAFMGSLSAVIGYFMNHPGLLNKESEKCSIELELRSRGSSFVPVSGTSPSYGT